MAKVLNQKNNMKTEIIAGSNDGIGINLCKTKLKNGYKFIPNNLLNDQN